jgi:hypothetical protein
MKLKSLVCGTFLAMVAFAAPASAAAIVGTFNIAGSAILTPVGSNYTLDFVPPVNPDPAGNGVWNSTFPATGYFTPIHPTPVSPVSQVTIKDTTDNAASAPPYTFVTTGAAVNVPNFLSTFTAIPGLHFDLTQIVASAAPICTGAETINQSCRPSANSPFTLTVTASGTTTSYGVLGYFRNGADEGFGGGAFTTQGSGQSVADILGLLAAGQPIAASASANFRSAAIPEPATLLTFGVGSGILALRRRRKAQQAQTA